MNKQPGTRPKVAHFGAYDHDSYGDLIFPWIVEHFLPGFDFIHVSPSGNATPWPDAKQTISVEEAFAIDDWDGVLIGGGDIIQSGEWITKNWAQPPLLSIGALPSLWCGASLLAAKLNIPCAWNCPGVPRNLPPNILSIAKEAVRSVDYLCLRDNLSAKRLNKLLSRPALVMPDTAINISQIWSASKANNNRKDKPLVLSLMPSEVSDRWQEIEILISALVSKKNLSGDVVILPLMGWQSESGLIAQNLKSKSGLNVIIKDRSLSLEMCALEIANSFAYVGNSLHGLITAVSYGVPGILVKPLGSEGNTKYDGFAEHFSTDGTRLLASNFIDAVDILVSGPQMVIKNTSDILRKHWTDLEYALLTKKAKDKNKYWHRICKKTRQENENLLMYGIEAQALIIRGIERDKHIALLSDALDSVIVDRDAIAAGIEQTKSHYGALTTDRDKHIALLSDALDSVIVDRDAIAAGIEQTKSHYGALTADRDKKIKQLSETLGSVIADRDAASEKIIELEVKCKQISTYSRVWLYTAPLRRQIKTLKSYLNHFRLAFVPGNGLMTINDSTSENALHGKELCEQIEYSYSERILLVSYYCPTRAHAGGLRILDIYALIKRKCPNIQLDIFTHHRPDIDWSIDDIYDVFDNVYLSPSEDLTPGQLESVAGKQLPYDIVDLQFHQTGYSIDAYRDIGRKIIFTPMESLAKAFHMKLRDLKQARKFFKLRKLATTMRSASDEVGFIAKADEVVCVSDSDAAFLRVVTSSNNVCCIETGISQFEFADVFEDSFTISSAATRPCKVLYIAYFGSETNVNALTWYLDNIHLQIKAKVPEYILTVVGRGDLSSFKKYQDDSVEFVGEVPALSPYIQDARIGIAPALSGSGFRGKVNQYSVMGVPSVVSHIAFKGLSYKDGIDIFVAETTSEFADHCIRLLTDTELNDRMGKAARELCINRYSWQVKWSAIRKVYKLEQVI